MLVLAQVMSASAHIPAGQSLNQPEGSDPWRFAAAWQLQPSEYAIEFCDSHATARAVFEILPLASLDPNDVGAKMDGATETMNTFSSHKVQRESISNGMEIPLSMRGNGSVDFLYQPEFGTAECISARLAIKTSGYYLVVATQDIGVAIHNKNRTDSQLESLAKCFTGGCTPPVATTAAASSSTVSAMLASLLLSLTSLGGVAILRLHRDRHTDQDEDTHTHHHGAAASASLVDLMTTFASGCLLGVVAFHLLPEATEKLNNEPDTPEWLVGALLMAGVFASLMIEVFVHVCLSGGSHDCHQVPTTAAPDTDSVPVKSTSNLLVLPLDSPSEPSSAASSLTTVCSQSPSPEKKEGKNGVDVVVGQPEPEEPHANVTRTTIAPTAWITAMGDLFHAFTDGIVLAVAFQSCSASLGWVVVLGILLHEVPHRIGDFFVFVRSGMSTTQAVGVNLVASLGSLAGVLTIVCLGEVSESTLGTMLALGAGLLLFIALAELLPPVLRVQDPPTAIKHLSCLAVGCALIWLSALHEVVCDAEKE